MFYWLPQLIAFTFYQFSWLLFVLRPTASYGLNADFEDHAEHEYMPTVQEHRECETTPFVSQFTADMSRAALASGVPSVITTLWEVRDDSTTVFFERFYKKIVQGTPRDVALGATTGVPPGQRPRKSGPLGGLCAPWRLSVSFPKRPEVDAHHRSRRS
jgi:hypothetical protein